MKKLISITLLFTMLFSLFPAELRQVWAQETDTIEVNQIIIGKDFGRDLRTVEGMHITIIGHNLQGISVDLVYGTGKVITITNTYNTSNIFHYKFNKDQISKLVNISQIIVGGKIYSLKGDTAKMPVISDISRKVNKDRDNLIIKGSNFSLLKEDANSSIEYGQGVSAHKIDPDSIKSDNEIKMSFEDNVKYELGMQDIFIKRKVEIEADDKERKRPGTSL